ncbi:hypothetical protein COM24_05835 [Bacillus toyonensis]|uniref:hypothetical protein n=1 Tax=Bacillus toyonensis TaxID=155322 RepID=UPI000BF76374|nr:hypothetical protein [Bacillus toyonensis]PGC57673.1 hypothetical protein COM24_05835 [Bacillus toyonensis]
MELKKIKLNKNYLENHKIGIHDYESFGRVLCEQVIDKAIKEIGNQEVESYEINLKVKVSVVTLLHCVKFCFRIDGVQNCIHLPGKYTF